MTDPTLLEKVREAIAYPIRKHELHEGRDIDVVVDEAINAMTPLELLEAISFALED